MWGANRIRYPGSPHRKRWILGVGGIDPFCAAVNTISIPPGEYDRKVETQWNWKISQLLPLKAAHWTATDTDARKCGYQTGLDTLVVHTVNDEYSLFAIYSKRPSESIKYSTWGVRRQR